MPTTSVPTTTRGRLRLVADLLLGVADDDPDLLPLAVGIADPGGGDVELSIRPLLGDHPLDDVLGFTAPRDWWAFGLVVRGRATQLPGPDRPGPHLDAPTPMRMVHLQPRRGRALSLLDLGEVHETPGGGESGRMVDACRRVLGRRSAPPRASARVLAEVVWVDRLLRHVIEDGCTRPDRTTISRLHPLAGGDPVPRPRGRTGLEDLANLGEQVAWSAAWGRWRRALAAGERTVLGIDPDVAAWMDDGMFQRWIHDEIPPMGGLVDDLGLLVSTAVLRDVLAVLRSIS